jgi:formate transporter
MVLVDIFVSTTYISIICSASIMEDAQYYTKCLLKAILAGMMISIGGVVCLSCDVRYVGAFLFSVGLFTVLFFGFNLYTGKVCYIFDNKPSYLIDILVIIVGNFIGCLIVGLAFPIDAAAMSCTTRLENYTFPTVLLKGVFCGILMYIAVEAYRSKGLWIATFICVPVFILSGFEHSIADMFYFASAGLLGLDALVFILTVLLGNAIGCVLIPVCRKYLDEPEAAAD